MQKVNVSIIIVYFSGLENLKETLQTVLSQKTKYSYETIVVNNGKESIKKAISAISSNIRYIKSRKNLGYGGGNNLGIKYAKGEYYFILNPDTKLSKNTLEVLVDYLDRHNDVAIVAPNLLQENKEPFEYMGARDLTPIAGMFAHSIINKMFPRNRISTNYYLLDVPKSRIREVSAVPGSACMIRKDVFEKVGRYDEKIFLYYEESDLGKRVRDAGYKLIITPKTSVIHKHSTHKNPELKKYNEASRFYYFKKHYGLISALLVEIFCRFSKWHVFLVIAICLVVALSQCQT